MGARCDELVATGPQEGLADRGGALRGLEARNLDPAEQLEESRVGEVVIGRDEWRQGRRRSDHVAEDTWPCD